MISFLVVEFDAAFISSCITSTHQYQFMYDPTRLILSYSIQPTGQPRWPDLTPPRYFICP
ncbi:hypothetical protein PROFUN_14375, partial [Planoprotostelium fungivorum]